MSESAVVKIRKSSLNTSDWTPIVAPCCTAHFMIICPENTNVLFRSDSADANTEMLMPKGMWNALNWDRGGSYPSAGDIIGYCKAETEAGTVTVRATT